MNDVDGVIYGNDGAERRKAQEASAADRLANADATIEASQLDISGEAKTARTLPTAEPPIDAVRMAHYATHFPFRDWCPICVASRTRSSPHNQVVVKKTADTLPKFQTHHTFIRTMAESKTQPCITFVETRSGVLISSLTCTQTKTREQCYDLLRQKKNHQTNEVVEAVHGNIQGLARCCRIQIETNTGIQIFSNFTCHCIFDSLRWICSLEIHSATRQQNLIPIFAQNSINSLCFPITQCVQPNCRTDASMVAGGEETQRLTNTWWGRNMVYSSADQFAENFLENNGVDVKRSKLEERSGILMWKWILEYLDHLWNHVETKECRQQRH